MTPGSHGTTWSVSALDEWVEPDAPIRYGILMPGPHCPNGVPVVKVRDYYSGSVNVENLALTDPEIDRQYARSRLRAGDILLSIRGTTGIVAVAPDALEGGNITQDTARIRVAPSRCQPYLFQALRSPFVQRQIASETLGQAVRGINVGAVRRIMIPTPPPSTQVRIAKILGAWDTAITQSASLMASARQLRMALMQQLLTGRRRFRQFARMSAMRATRFAPIPADWAYPPIGSVASEVALRPPSSEQLPVLSCTKHEGLVDSLDYFGRRVFSEDTSAYKVVKRGQFAYATNHLEEGSIGLLDSLDAGIVSPMYTVFRVSGQIYAPFLYKLFKTDLYRHIFQVNTSASVNRRGALRWSDFARIHVPLPSLAEQGRISDCIDSCTTDERLLSAQLEALQRQRRALMQELLAGHTRVES
jgi:restriction endonuclease S subunit